MTVLYPWGLAALSGILCFLSFPLYSLDFLPWIALIPLILALENKSVRKSFWLGGLTGSLYFLGTIHWVTHTMVHYGKLPVLLSVPIMLALVMYLALYVAVFAAAYRFLRNRLRISPILLAPVLWTSLELLRAHALSGFPWASLGYSQYRSLSLIQIADITSVYGISFLLVMVNTAIVQGASALKNRAWNRRAWGPVLTAFLLITGVLGYGSWRLVNDLASESPAIRVGVVQANIPQDIKWDKRFRQETFDRYRRLSSELIFQSVDLVVWPEAAMPFFYEKDPLFRKQVESVTEVIRRPLLFGSPALTNDSGRTRILNSAYLLAPGGKILGRYDKMHLVPFGEYVPFSGLLFFVDKMVEGIGDFIPGQSYTLFPLGEIKLGTVICFEVIFPDHVRRFVKEGAQVMITITNDAWFGDSSAPAQHFSMVVFRSVENRVPFVRSANTGISGFIDRVGRIQMASPIFVETVIAETVRPRIQTTFYTRYGDVFAYFCVILIFIFFTIALRRSAKPKELFHD